MITWILKDVVTIHNNPGDSLRVIFHYMAVGQNQWYQFGVNSPPILEPILVVGLNRMFTGGTGLGF